MAKKSNSPYPFLDSIANDSEIYVAIFNRTKTSAWVNKCKYNGYIPEKYSYYSTDNGSLYPCAPFKVTEDRLKVKFSFGKKQFTIKFNDNGLCCNNEHRRSWYGNDHEAFGIELNKELIPMLTGWNVFDCYITTDKEKFNSFLKEERVLDTAISDLEKKEKAIQKQLKELKQYINTL